ncbi:polysaccharide pyruvyl transferase family protein [Bacteroides rodentium]
MGNKRVAIVTWIKYPNFGTFLQAYALQQVISDLGYEVYILDDSLILEESKKNAKEKNIVFRLLFALKFRFAYLLQYSRNKKYFNLCRKGLKLYDSFLKTHLRVDKNTLPLANLDNRYDIFVCGSDQIWFPSLSIFSPYYYLSFTSKKKVAYAPSIGVTKYPEAFIPMVKPLLDRLDALSVREKKGADVLKAFLHREVEDVLDPTLLLSADIWSKLLVPYRLFTGEYVFCYFLSYNEDYMQYVREFASRRKLPIVVFALENRNWSFGDEMIAGGPQEFLTAIRDASFVFTDSFHGTIFSLHFKKKICVFKRFEDNDSNNQNSRIINLLKLVNLEDYFIGKSDLWRIETLSLIDYKAVHAAIQQERDKSITYLKNSLAN